MMQVAYREWIFDCEAEATRKVYDGLASGGAEDCGCGYCRNFAEARQKIYPAEILDLFVRLGIDYRKEAEAYQIYQDESGLHHYGAWFHFVGRILDQPGGPEKLSEQFSIDFFAKSDLAAKDFANHPLVQVEITTEIPWALKEDKDLDNS